MARIVAFDGVPRRTTPAGVRRSIKPIAPDANASVSLTAKAALNCIADIAATVDHDVPLKRRTVPLFPTAHTLFADVPETLASEFTVPLAIVLKVLPPIVRIMWVFG